MLHGRLHDVRMDSARVPRGGWRVTVERNAPAHGKARSRIGTLPDANGGWDRVPGTPLWQRFPIAHALDPAAAARSAAPVAG
jgi:hypothetical protein